MPTISSDRTTYKDIAFRLGLTHKSKIINEFDIASWCAECEIEYLGDVEAMHLYEKTELTVDTTNYRAELPCNVYRILDVYDSSDVPVYYDHKGTYIFFSSEFTSSTVYINYYGISMDPDTGYPYIKKGHEQACEAFCVNRLYYEDYLTGKIPQHVWAEITDRLDNELRAAKSSFRHVNNEELRRIKVVMFNMLPSIGNESLSHLRFGDE